MLFLIACRGPDSRHRRPRRRSRPLFIAYLMTLMVLRSPFDGRVLQLAVVVEVLRTCRDRRWISSSTHWLLLLLGPRHKMHRDYLAAALYVQSADGSPGFLALQNPCRRRWFHIRRFSFLI